MSLEVPIFPLRTVLFPGGLLPLKIFEQRYLDMTKICIRDGTPFGVCLIRDGDEVGAPAVPHAVGCTALIEEWEMPHLGLFHLLCRGESVFRITEQWTAKNRLLHARVELRDAPAPQQLAPAYQPLADLLERIIDKVGAERFPAPMLLQDADWVASRLTEILPLEPALKQQMLESREPEARLEQLWVLLQSRPMAV